MWKIDDTTIVFGPMDCPTPDWRTPKQVWSVYLLCTVLGTRTYIGATTDIRRRLRQHNGEIVGGARSTRNKGLWKVVAVVSGFQNRSVCYRWEKLIKSRCKGLAERLAGMTLVANGICPSMGKRKQYEVPQGLELHV